MVRGKGPKILDGERLKKSAADFFILLFICDLAFGVAEPSSLTADTYMPV